MCVCVCSCALVPLFIFLSYFVLLPNIVDKLTLFELHNPIYFICLPQLALLHPDVLIGPAYKWAHYCGVIMPVCFAVLCRLYIFFSFGITGFILSQFENRVSLKPVLWEGGWGSSVAPLHNYT